MTSSPDAIHDVQAEALMHRASALEARGAWADAVDAWARVVELAPGFLPATLSLAQAQLRAGRPADALAALIGASSRAPAHPAVWLALGVAHSMLGDHASAIESATRAQSLAPGNATLLVGLADVLHAAGRLDDAAAAYRRAIAIAPDHADALNKLSVVERAYGRYDAAESLLRRAVAGDARHAYARVNLATLALERGREGEGIAALREVLALPLPPDARDEAEGALAVHDEHAALAGSLAAALADDTPAALDAAMRGRGRRAEHDASLVADLDRIADALARATDGDLGFATGLPSSIAWPALEAHHNFHRSVSGEDVSGSVELVAGRRSAVGDDDDDILRYAKAVASRPGDRWPWRDAIACLAWLQWRHAQFTGHRHALAPGRLKLINNLVTDAPQVRRTPPRRIAGTLDVVLSGIVPRLPSGPHAAILLYVAIGEMHPFRDGNGRVMRFMLNRMLTECGRFPHLRRAGSDGALVARLRKTGDPAPLVEWLAEGSRYAASLDREWVAREPR